MHQVEALQELRDLLQEMSVRLEPQGLPQMVEWLEVHRQLEGLQVPQGLLRMLEWLEVHQGKEGRLGLLQRMAEWLEVH